MERVTKKEIRLGFVDSSTLPSYPAIYERLRKYEDAEEQGLLLRLPCLIGTTVYGIDKQIWIDNNGCKDCGYYYDSGIEEWCDYDEDVPPACAKVFETKFKLTMIDKIGKSIFLTKEEAEQKLAEMKG